MKRVGLYLGVSPHSGGAYQYALAMLSALKQLEGNSIELVVAVANKDWISILNQQNSSGTVIYIDNSIISTLEYICVRLRAPIPLWRKYQVKFGKLQHTLTQANCDVWIFPAQEHLAYSLKLPSIAVVHDLMHRYERSFPEVSSFGIYARREHHYKQTCKYSIAILVDSEVGRQHIIEAYAPLASKVKVLPYCPPPEIPSATEFELDTLASFELTDRPFFFYPAQFWKHKNHSRLIDAFAPIALKNPEVCMVLAGTEKNSLVELKAKIRQLNLENSIVITGYIPDQTIQTLYRYALALIMPTFFGPTNIPPLEAMRAGCPMALSDIYGMREQSGDAAIYFDPKNTTEMTACMSLLLNNSELRARLKNAGLEKAKLYNLESFTSNLKAILASL